MVAVMQPVAALWYTQTSQFWNTGPGGSNYAGPGGIVTGLGQANASLNIQCGYVAGTSINNFPGTESGYTNYWLDVQVNTGGALAGWIGQRKAAYGQQ